MRTISVDVTNEDQVRRMFEEVGAFDHLVVTRGVPPVAAPIAQMDLDEVRRFIEVMCVSSVSLAKHALKTLRVGGSITFTSGISNDRPSTGGTVVAAVAGSFDYSTRALALEIAPTRVNVVSPGWVDTPMWDELAGAQKHEIWQQMAAPLPAKRIGSIQEIALAYLFLLESDFTTGIVLDIDGGHHLV